MKDRFDLEQQIMECWNIVEDIDVTTSHFVDNPKWAHIPPDVCDALMNKYFAIKELYEIRFERLWETFGELIPAMDAGSTKVDITKDVGEVSTNISFSDAMDSFNGYSPKPNQTFDTPTWDNMTYTVNGVTGDESAITFTFGNEDHDYNEQK